MLKCKKYVVPKRSLINGCVEIIVFKEQGSFLKDKVKLALELSPQLSNKNKEIISLLVFFVNTLTPLSTAALTFKVRVPVSPFTMAVLNYEDMEGHYKYQKQKNTCRKCLQYVWMTYAIFCVFPFCLRQIHTVVVRLGL